MQLSSLFRRLLMTERACSSLVSDARYGHQLRGMVKHLCCPAIAWLALVLGGCSRVPEVHLTNMFTQDVDVVVGTATSRCAKNHAITINGNAWRHLVIKCDGVVLNYRPIVPPRKWVESGIWQDVVNLQFRADTCLHVRAPRGSRVHGGEQPLAYPSCPYLTATE